MHQSIPAVPILPPPPGNRGHLVTLSVPGVGHSQFYRARGLGIFVHRGNTRTFDTRVFESAMDKFSGKGEASLEQWLVRQGLEKLIDVLWHVFSIMDISSFT